MENMGAKHSPRKYQNGWKLMLDEYIQCLKDLDLTYVEKLWMVTQSAKDIWDNYGILRDEYIKRAEEEREEYKRIAEEKGLIKEKKPKAQALLKIRCSPKSIAEIMQVLDQNKEKMRAIEEMGFRSLKYLHIVQLDLKLVKKLLDRFDPVLCSLDGVKITAEDVKNVLGIPAGGSPIPNSLSDAAFSAFKAKFGKKSLGKLKEAIKSSGEADGSFKEAFILFVLGNFLCPSVKDEPSQKLYEALSIISDAPQYNWVEFVLQWLVKGIKDYQEKRRPGIGGCIYFLMIFYLHRVCPLPADGDKPLMFVWTNEKIKSAVDKKMDNKCDEEKPFLDENIQELYRMVHSLAGRVAELERASIPAGQPSASPSPKPSDAQERDVYLSYSPACDPSASPSPKPSDAQERDVYHSYSPAGDSAARGDCTLLDSGARGDCTLLDSAARGDQQSPACDLVASMRPASSWYFSRTYSRRKLKSHVSNTSAAHEKVASVCPAVKKQRRRESIYESNMVATGLKRTIKTPANFEIFHVDNVVQNMHNLRYAGQAKRCRDDRKDAFEGTI